MKRLLAMFLCGVLAILLIGCKKSDVSESINQSTIHLSSVNSEPTINVSTENPQYFFIEYDAATFMYNYCIYDINGNILDSDAISREPHISLVDNNIVCFWTQFGTGSLVRGTRFYDVATGTQSPNYGGVVERYGNLVANSTFESVIISDMFSGRVLQVIDDTSTKGLFYGGVEPISDIKFNEDGTKISISYLNSDYDEVTEIFDIKLDNALELDSTLFLMMENKDMFIDENGNKTYLRDYDLGLTEAFFVEAEKYVIYDIDKDSENELVLDIKNIDAFIILDHDDGEIYGHTMWIREFNLLNVNGEFLQSGGAGVNAISCIEFDKTSKNVITIAEKNDYDKIYKKYEYDVDKEEVEKHFDKFDKSSKCVWSIVE